MRLARDFGTVSELFPQHFDDLRDLPHPFFDLIRRAMLYLGFDELDEDEVPPKRIWSDDEQLSEWFSEIRRRRKRKAEGKDDWSRDIDDPVDNAAAAGLIVG